MKRLAIYPGSFNPMTIGHLSILEKAEAIFDEVIIAIGVNPEKKVDEKISRLETLKRQLPPNKKVEEFKGFLVDYVNKKVEEGYDVTVVRGLRNGADLDFEVNQLRVMEDQDPRIKMVFIPCDRRYEHVSSSMVRAMEKIQEGSASEYIMKPEKAWNNGVRPGIVESMNEKMKREYVIYFEDESPDAPMITQRRNVAYIDGEIYAKKISEYLSLIDDGGDASRSYKYKRMEDMKSIIEPPSYELHD